MKKEKRAELAMRQLVIIILSIIVLLAILIFIFRVDILEWLRNLPDYTYGEEEPIDYTELDPNKLAMLGCYNKIAELGEGDATSFWEDFGFTDVREILMFPDKRELNLHAVYNDDESFLIRIADKNVGVGKIENRELSIDDDVMSDYGGHEVSGYVSFDDLSRLDGSRLYGRLLCKTDEQMQKISVRRNVLGTQREIFLSEGGCTVDLKEKGKYGLEDGKLIYYDGTDWVDVDDEIPTQEQVEEAQIIHNLRDKEKEVLNLIANSKVCTKALGTYMGMGYDQGDVTKWCFRTPREIPIKVKEIGQGENLDGINYLDEHSDFIIIFGADGKEFTASFSNLYKYVGDSRMSLVKEGSKIYLWSREGNYAVRGGKIYFLGGVGGNRNWDSFDTSKNPFISKSLEELEKMKNWGKIKQDLIEACKENGN